MNEEVPPQVSQGPKAPNEKGAMPNVDIRATFQTLSQLITTQAQIVTTQDQDMTAQEN